MASFKIVSTVLNKYEREILDFYFTNILKLQSEDYKLLQFDNQIMTNGYTFETVQKSIFILSKAYGCFNCIYEF